MMYQNISCQDRFWVIELITNDLWDGVGYPSNCKAVWACLLTNETELADLTAFWERVKDIPFPESPLVEPL
jgi:hypothetical protein